MYVKLLLLAVMASVVPSFAYASEDSTIEVEPETEIRFLKNFDRKIQSLENYSVTFDDGTVMRAAHRPVSRDGLHVKLIAAKKKS